MEVSQQYQEMNNRANTQTYKDDYRGNNINYQIGSPMDSGLYVSLPEAEDYLSVIKGASVKIALGVMLCILSPVLLIFLGGLQEKYGISDAVVTIGGLVPLFVMVAAAVMIFIITGITTEKYEVYKNEILTLDAQTEEFLKQNKEDKQAENGIRLAIGVCLCIVSVIPVVVIGCLHFKTDFPVCLSIVVMLAIISIGVFEIVSTGIKMSSYDILLQTKDYSKENKKGSVPAAIFFGIFWPVVTSIYLYWSFTTGDWGNTWIIWPFAGVLSTVVTSIIKVVARNR